MSCRRNKYGYDTAALCWADQQYSSYADCLSKMPNMSYEQCYFDLNKDKAYYDVDFTPTTAYGQREDGAIGAPSWDMLRNAAESVIGQGGITISNSTDAETILFWYQLKQVGLIDGITDAGVRKNTDRARFGETHPASELGGGFWAAHSDGCCGYQESVSLTTGRPESAGPFTLNGNIIVMSPFIRGSREASALRAVYRCGKAQGADSEVCRGVEVQEYILNSNPEDNILIPEEAKSIDTKLDDGNPATGIVQTYGKRSSCYKSFGGGFVYNEKENGRHCGL